MLSEINNETIMDNPGLEVKVLITIFSYIYVIQ